MGMILLAFMLASACGGGQTKDADEPDTKVDKVSAAKKSLDEAIEAEQAGKPDLADKHYKRALRLRPAHFEIVERYARFLLAQGRNDDAIQVANNFLSRSLGETKGYHLLADAQMAAEDWVSAHGTLTELIELDGGDGRAYEKRGTVQVMRKNYDAAFEDLKKAIELDGKNPDFYASLGSAYQRAGRQNEAGIELRKALQIDPRHARAHLLLGVVLREDGEYKAALDHHEKAVNYAPDSARAYFERGVSQNYLGDNPGAEISLKKATELDPRDKLNWYAYGEVLRNMERYKEAIQPYRKSLEIDPNFTKAADKLGVVLFYAGELGEAETLLTERVKTHPNEPYAYFNLGQVYAKAEKHGFAIEAFEKFLKLAPEGDGDIAAAKKMIRDLKKKQGPVRKPR